MAGKHNITQYTKWAFDNLGKLIQEAKEARRFNYQIIGWQKGACASEDRLVVKVVGANTSIPLTPLEIYHDNSLINGFSPSDVKIIATLALSVQNEPECQLLLQEFRGSLDDYVIVYSEKGGAKRFRITVEELAKNMALIKKFSQEDAFHLGMAFAENQVRKEKKLLRALKSFFSD